MKLYNFLTPQNHPFNILFTYLNPRKAPVHSTFHTTRASVSFPIPEINEEQPTKNYKFKWTKINTLSRSAFIHKICCYCARYNKTRATNISIILRWRNLHKNAVPSILDPDLYFVVTRITSKHPFWLILNNNWDVCRFCLE